MIQGAPDWEGPEGQEFLKWWRQLTPEDQKAIQKQVNKLAGFASALVKSELRRKIWRDRIGKGGV